MIKSIRGACSLLRTFRARIGQLPNVASALIKYGTFIVGISALLFSIFVVCMYIFPMSPLNPGYFTLAEYAKVFYSNALFALCVVWGGALFIDCNAKVK